MKKDRDTTHDDILIIDAPKKKKNKDDEFMGSYGDDRMKEISGY